MIFISENKHKSNNQSEKSSRLIAKNELVSAESSLKKIVEVKDEDEEKHHRVLSDHSKTISYDNLKYGDIKDKPIQEASEKAAKEPKKEENPNTDKKSLQKQMYKKAVRENNYAQVEQNSESLEVTDTESGYVPPLRTAPHTDLSPSAMSSVQAVHSTEGLNQDLVSTKSSSAQLVGSTAISDGKAAQAKGGSFKKNAKLKHLKEIADSKKPKSAPSSGNYTIVESTDSFKHTDGKVSLDNSTSNSLKVGASLSKTNKDKVISRCLYNQSGGIVNTKGRRYKALIKRHQLKKAGATAASGATIARGSKSSSLSSQSSDSVTLQENSKPTVSNSSESYGTGAVSPYSVSNGELQNLSPISGLRASAAAGSPKVKTVSFGLTAARAAAIRLRNKKLRADSTQNGNALSDKKPPSMKSMFSKSCKDLIKSTTDKIYFGTKQNIYSFVKSGAEASAESTPETQGVVAVFQLVETTKNAKMAYLGTLAAVNTTINAVKGTVNTVKGARKGIKNTQRLVKRLRRMHLRQAARFGKAHLKRAAKSTVKAVANSVANSAKAAAASVLAIVFSFLIVMFFSFGLVAAIVSMFVWQTPSDLDTTQLVKYISGLDKDMQNDWYRGKTAAQITKQNDNSSDRSYEYHYYIAYNKMPDTYDVTQTYDESDFNCIIKETYNPENGFSSISSRGYDKKADSCDEFLECCRWTTEDYMAALAYLQIKNENLGWFSNLFGWVGEQQLKADAKELHELTYGNQIYEKLNSKTGDISYYNGVKIYNTDTMAGDTREYCYFGRKNSVRFIIENDLLPEPLTDEDKERFNYICAYGNSELSVLNYPLDGDISIAKHFGEQVYLTFEPAEDSEKYPSVKKKTGSHYAVDLNASEGDIIKSPMSGYCKVSQQDKRGFEFVISNNVNFETGDNGYLCRISCAATSYIPLGTIQEVTAGQAIGKAANIQGINSEKPTGVDDVFADKLYPCGTNTEYHTCDSQGCTSTSYTGEYIHLELYKLPCDFTSAADMEKNVLAPELCFKYPDNDIN